MPLLTIAFGIFSVAVLLGTVLAIMHLRAAEGGTLPPWSLGLAHGVVGALGFAVLAWALASETRVVGAFGWDALALLGGALPAGIAIPLLARSVRAGVGVAMALHASVAIIGYVILMAYVSVR